MVNTPEQAINKAATQAANGPKFGTGLCLREVRTCYMVNALASDAAEAWNIAKVKHHTTDPNTIPRGVPVFWTGGSAGHGHIAISTGDGYCYSTDIKRAGYFDRVPIALIHEKWGLSLVGWTEDLNGVRVWTKPVAPVAPVEKPATKPTGTPTYLDVTLALQHLAATTRNPAAKPIYLRARSIIGKLVRNDTTVRIPETTSQVLAVLAYRRDHTPRTAFWTRYRLTTVIRLLRPLA